MASNIVPAFQSLPEISSTGSHPLQLPLLPDPGKQGDITVTSENLDFSVRLGTSLAREGDLTDKVSPRKTSTSKKSPRVQISRRLSVNNGSVLITPSPRNSNGDSNFKFGTNDVGKQVRKKRESRQSRHVFSSYITESESPRIKFQRIINTIRRISSVCLALKRYVQDGQTHNWSFMEMYLHVKEDLDKQVVFNPQNFRKNEPEQGRLKKLLSIPGPDRKSEHIKKILALLRGNASFQDYPGPIQVQLAHCMEYQSYEARRVVLKQGHRPEAFYILLSGNVIANVQETNPSSGKIFIRTVHEMGPGATFGEIALIDGGQRTATIVCKTAVELLVVLKDDFDSIIRVPLLRQRDEHVEFCKTVPLLRDFPCEKLTENPSQFFYQYFKKGDTVVKNSRDSKHIIVVKAGKCQVISTFTESLRRPHTSASGSKAIEQAFPLYTEMRKIPSMIRRPKSEGDKLKENICLGLLTGTIDKTRLADHGPDVQRPETAREPLEEKKKPLLQKSNTLSDFFEHVDKERRESFVTNISLQEDIQSSFWSRRLQGGKAKRTPASSAKTDRKTTMSSPYRPPHFKFNSRRDRRTNYYYTPEKTSFAQIAELRAGTVFGLESLVQKPSTTFSLVSEGAECIFISKRLFLSLANIKVLRIVTDIVQTYPSQESIEEQVKQYRKWQKYKAGLVQEVLNRHK